MLHIWYVIFSSQLCTPTSQLVLKSKNAEVAAYSQLEKSFLPVWCESLLANAKVYQTPFVEWSIYPEVKVISKMLLLLRQEIDYFKHSSTEQIWLEESRER